MHLTARSRAGTPSLCGAETGSWLWAALRRAFPRALGATLMPDHPHLVTPNADADAERAAARLGRVFADFARCFGLGRDIAVVAPPQIIADRQKLARHLRYLALNPCRGGLCSCPLAWEWSTHRDVIGAIADPWLRPADIARRLGTSPRGFARRHHEYVSSDPSVNVGGSPFPESRASCTIPEVPLQTIAEAAAAATRSDLTAVRQRSPTRVLFVRLATDQGWNHASDLARVAGCTPRAIADLRRRGTAEALDAAALCLGDLRLRQRTAM